MIGVGPSISVSRNTSVPGGPEGLPGHTCEEREGTGERLLSDRTDDRLSSGRDRWLSSLFVPSRTVTEVDPESVVLGRRGPGRVSLLLLGLLDG